MKDQSLRVLIIEDSEDDALLIIRELKKGGYKPIYERVKTAAAIKKALQEKQWDIILCDYKMPRFNAPSAIALLKESDIDIPLIVITGKIGEETAAECMRLGAKDYIMKGNLSRLCPAITRELEDVKVRNKQNHMDEKLRREEQRFRAFIEHSSDIIVILNLEGIITYINPAVERVLGFKPEERIGAKGFELIHPDNVKSLSDTFNTLARNTKAPVFRGEIHLRHKNGSWRTLEAVGSNLVNNNVVEAVIVNYRDITERKRTEEKLREKEQRFRTFVENSPDIIAILNREGIITYENQALERSLGLKIEERIGGSIFDRIHPDDLKFASDAFKKFTLNTSSQDINSPVRQIRLHHQDGSWRTFETSGSKLLNDNLVEAVIINLRDITERKRAEEELRESEIKYRTLIETTDTGYVIIDQDGLVRDANSEYVRLTGHHDLSEIIGKSVIEWTAESEKEKNAEAMKACFNKGYIRNLEIDYVDAKGNITPIEINATCIKIEGKIHTITICRDITERKKAAEELQKSETQLRATLESTADGILAVNNDGKVLHANRRFVDLWRIPPSLIERRDDPALLDFVLSQLTDPEVFLKKVQSLYDSDAEDMDHVIFKDGRYFERYTLPMIMDGIRIGRVWSFRDITDRNRAEEALRESEELYRTIFESTGTSMILIEEDMTISMANGEFVRNTEYSPDEINGRMKWTEIVHQDDLGRMVEQHRLRRQSQGDALPSYEFRYITKTGHVMETLLNIKLVPGTKKSIASLINITERKKAEDKLQRTLESLRKAVGTTIQVLVSAVESRDSYTSGHQSRSADLACAIATEMGLAPEKIEGIHMAGIIHDIGKLSIPAEILSKPTKLTDIEFLLIKEHSRSGYEMLKDVESPWPLAEIVYQHHERMNGSGYPRNLKGDEILIESQILAAADVVEAMASHRPYRPTLGIEAALEEIEKNKGILYDHAVADACLRLFREKGYQLK